LLLSISFITDTRYFLDTAKLNYESLLRQVFFEKYRSKDTSEVMNLS